MNDDNRPEKQTSQSDEHEESSASQPPQHQQHSEYHALHAKAQTEQKSQETPQSERSEGFSVFHRHASSQTQTNQAESRSQYEPQSAYRTLNEQVQARSEPQASQPQSWRAEAAPSPQYQGQPYNPQTQPNQQSQPQTYQQTGQYASQQNQPQASYQQSQYQPYQPQYPLNQQPQSQYQQYQQSGLYPQQSGQYPPQHYSQQQYLTYQYPSYPQQQFGVQPQYQQYGQPQYRQYQQPQPQYQYQQPGIGYRYPAQPQYVQQPVQFARPAFNGGYFYQPNPAWQTAMSRWLSAVRKRFSNIGFILAMVILVWNVLALVISRMSTLFIDPKKLPMWAVLLMGNGPLYVIAIPLALLIFRTMPQVKRKTSNMSIGMFLAVMAISFPLADIGNFIGNILSAMFSSGQAENSVSELTQRLDPVSLLLFTVIIAPIFEEWLFRRLLIDHIQQFGEKTAILVSAFAFGLFHGNLFQFFYAFAFGLLLAYVYVRTGKLRYTIAMHMTFNFFGGFLPQMAFLAMSKSTLDTIGTSGGMRQILATGHGAEVAPYLFYLVFNGVMFIVGIVVAILERKKLVFYSAPEELPRGARAKTVLGNPGAIVFIVLCALEMIAALFNI
ncbi:type II CAAX endopeptidase family protein [Bifidobacterium sp. ESL0690]|uniref:type II CAAX endopeptidase family protein n=1 Tax=Bifidobacterium sp. ESL0690 TaxID=2983214 RepID=UPI0023F82AB2|nr:type II CAAX endopeptidase family protein [Bifidobacterium sp. ESL0690]WEV46504.1 type II CAAX endopeptidase family protein [Bifidobacterium sp. ESL0690]